MKNKIVAALKIALPLSFGAFIIWAFYDAMCEEQRKEMFKAFRRADYFWVAFSLVFGFASHLSRSWRWRYLIEPLGKKPGFWPSYHAVMSGYLVNFMFPRAGEASRAAILARNTGLPFNKVFGTIVAERALDLVMLGIIVVSTLLLQLENIDMFQSQITNFNSGGGACGSSPILSWLGKIVTWLILLGVLSAIVFSIVKPSFRDKLFQIARGVWEGITSIFRSKYKGQFILHTLIIWICYILFFAVCFPALEATAHIGTDGILAGFIAGTIGIILVQGGIGVYPAFVGLILTSYIDGTYDLGVHPQGLALGWLIWTSQTAMMILLGLISLIYAGRLPSANENTSENNQ